MPSWLKSILIFTLGPVVLSLLGGFLWGARNTKKGFETGTLRIVNGKAEKVQQTKAAA